MDFKRGIGTDHIDSARYKTGKINESEYDQEGDYKNVTKFLKTLC